MLTGSAGDRPLVDRLKALLPPEVQAIDLAGHLDLVTLAAVLERLTVFITGDTGPMHLAAAVGTPIVALFGPSAPERWGPLTASARIVRIDLPCSPCNRIRRPPARCLGHVPDCLAGITVARVCEAAGAAIAELARTGAPMPAEAARLRIRGRQSEREVDLGLYLDARAAETAEREANQWIKSLRHARVDGVPFRDRFTHRGDSLWWFAELYLHKLHVTASVLRSVSALERLVAEESPAAISVVAGDDVVRVMAPLVAARHRVACEGGSRTALRAGARLGLSGKGAFHAAGAVVDRLRPGSRVSSHRTRSDVAAFVHSAFWRGGDGRPTKATSGLCFASSSGSCPAIGSTWWVSVPGRTSACALAAPACRVRRPAGAGYSADARRGLRVLGRHPSLVRLVDGTGRGAPVAAGQP